MVRQRQGKALRVVVPFIVNITEEMNFWSKLYSKGCMTGSPLSCTSFEEMVSYPHNVYRYFRKVCYLWYLSDHKVVYRYDFRQPV